jgi:hypothetical protein
MQSSGRSARASGVALGVVGALLVALAGALAVAESWRVDERCVHSWPPSGFTPLGEGPEDAMPTLLPIGYRCVWEGVDGQISTMFVNWPLTIAMIAGLTMIVLAGWMLSRDRMIGRSIE